MCSLCEWYIVAMMLQIETLQIPYSQVFLVLFAVTPHQCRASSSSGSSPHAPWRGPKNRRREKWKLLFGLFVTNRELVITETTYTHKETYGKQFTFINSKTSVKNFRILSLWFVCPFELAGHKLTLHRFSLFMYTEP